jgi:hypothetical protein
MMFILVCREEGFNCFLCFCNHMLGQKFNLCMFCHCFETVFTAVQDYQQRHVKSSCDTPFEREPLFPLPCFPSSPEANCEILRGPINSGVKTSSPCQQPPKKTLAAALVESTKRQSVALVPKEVAKLAQSFFPFFNPSLFPRKPPPAAVVNRVLFTDAEDE